MPQDDKVPFLFGACCIFGASFIFFFENTGYYKPKRIPRLDAMMVERKVYQLEMGRTFYEKTEENFHDFALKETLLPKD